MELNIFELFKKNIELLQAIEFKSVTTSQDFVILQKVSLIIKKQDSTVFLALN